MLSRLCIALWMSFVSCGAAHDEQDQDSGSLDVLEGPVEPSAAYANCSPTDGPAVSLEFGLAEETCEVWTVQSEVTILVEGQFDQLEPDTYAISSTTWGFRVGADGQVFQAVSGALVIETWDEDGADGTYSLTFDDGLTVEASFVDVAYCPMDPDIGGCG